MNELLTEPAKEWYQKRSNILKLLVIVVILGGLLAFIIIFMVTPPIRYDTGCYSGYCTARAQIQNAVTNYLETHNKSLPILSGTYTNANCSNCHVINISALVVENGGLLRVVPSGTNLSTSGNDNCGGNASLGCSNHSGYIWIVNTSGDVFSYCAGANCETNNSGYQGVWP